MARQSKVSATRSRFEVLRLEVLRFEVLELRQMLAADISVGQGTELGWPQALEQGVVRPMDVEKALTAPAEQFYQDQVEQSPLVSGFQLVDTSLSPEVPFEERSPLVMSWKATPRDLEVLGVGALDLSYPTLGGEDLTDMQIRFSVDPPTGVGNISLELIDVDGNVRGWFDGGDAPNWPEVTLDPNDVSLQSFDFMDSDVEFDITRVSTIRLEQSWIVSPQSGTGDINLDGVIGFDDFLILSGNFGQPNTVADIDLSGFVDFADFLILSGNFGQTRVFHDMDPATGMFTPWNAWHHLVVEPAPGVATVQPVTPAEIAARLPAVDFVLLDVRTQQEWEQDGHIDSATLLTWPNPLQTNIESEIAKDAEIVVYCRSGNRSGRAAAWLIEQGYTNVNDLGGIAAWKAAGLPVLYGP